jgi:hypothetical protein
LMAGDFNDVCLSWQAEGLCHLHCLLWILAGARMRCVCVSVERERKKGD